MNAPRWILLPALALIVAGCADSLTSPETPLSAEGHVALLSNHTYTEGNTVRGHSAPEVITDVIGDRVELCATWEDFSNFDPEDPHVYSFEVELLEGEEWGKIGKAGGQGSEPTACFTTDPLEPGTYLFRVKGMANVPTGGTPPYTPHHTEYWEDEVTVGSELRFEVLVRNNGGQDFGESIGFNQSARNWNFQLMLQTWDAAAAAFVPVTSCETFPWEDIVSNITWDAGAPTGAAEALTLRDPCEDGTPAIYKVRLDNPTSNGQGQSRSGTMAFTIDGVMNENEVSFESN